MGGGNGCKSAMSRDRNKKNAPKIPNSQLKSNEKALAHVCDVCCTSFLCTASEKILAEHAEAKHKKSLAECFPTYKK